MTEERRLERVQYNKDWKKRTGYNAKMKEKRKQQRISVLKYYSASDIPKCACCEESTYEFLALDHKNGNGNYHRKSIRAKNGGYLTVEWIIKNNFPEMFQVLCHNCNMAKGFWGKCPHTQK